MGIIAGIAIPTTIAVINRQKKNAAVKSAETVVSAAKSVLLEASTGQSIDYVTPAAEGDGKKYTTTAALLASNAEIEKDPSDTGCTMDIIYHVPASGQAYYTVTLSEAYKINGVALTVTTTTTPVSGTYDGFATA